MCLWNYCVSQLTETNTNKYMKLPDRFAIEILMPVCPVLKAEQQNMTSSSLTTTLMIAGVVVMMITLLVAPTATAATIRDEISTATMMTTPVNPCNKSGCCDPNNYNSPGPLIAGPNNTDYIDYGKTAQLYGCVQHYTSLLWFKKENDLLIPYPFGIPERVKLEPSRHNQTLYIIDSMESDSGVFLYVASNGTHNVTGTFTLHDQCRNPRVDFSTSTNFSIQYVDVGSDKTLFCGLSYPCKDSLKWYDVYWQWADGRGNKAVLLNNTHSTDMDGTVSVSCDGTGFTYYGVNCTLTISPVQQQHYNGVFVCLIASNNTNNQTVQLRPPEIRNVLPSWAVPLIVVSGLLIVLLAVKWRYGHRIAYKFRTLPPRGECEHDAVIVHEEDHADFVRNELEPRLREFGYHVLEEPARLGSYEALGKTEAVLNSYRVVLTLSGRELQDPETDMYTRAASLKAPRSVVFVRCPHFQFPTSQGNSSLADAEEREGRSSEACGNGAEAVQPGGEDYRSGGQNNPNSSSAEDQRLVESANRNPNQGVDVWNDSRLKDIKVLDWPGSDVSGMSKLKTVKAEKFWYKLRKHLPKADTERTGQRRSRRDCSSSGSGRRLLSQGETSTYVLVGDTQASHVIPASAGEDSQLASTDDCRFR